MKAAISAAQRARVGFGLPTRFGPAMMHLFLRSIPVQIAHVSKQRNPRTFYDGRGVGGSSSNGREEHVTPALRTNMWKNLRNRRPRRKSRGTWWRGASYSAGVRVETRADLEALQLNQMNNYNNRIVCQRVPRQDKWVDKIRLARIELPTGKESAWEKHRDCDDFRWFINGFGYVRECSVVMNLTNNDFGSGGFDRCKRLIEHAVATAASYTQLHY